MVVSVIGAGAIGSAVAKGLVKSGVVNRVIATRRHVEKIQELEGIGVIVTNDNKKAATEADTVILCVKPKDVRSVLQEIRDQINGKLVISVAAAVSLGLLRKAAPEARFVRAMPNMAILVQESFTAYSAGEDVTEEDRTQTEKLLGALGRAVEVDEKHMDVITALSGCAPGYLSVMVEAMVQAGLENGLSEELALAASAQSMLGAGRLFVENGLSPSEIVRIVATPGGVTEKELKELREAGVTRGIVSAIKAGTEKSRKISEILAQEES